LKLLFTPYIYTFLLLLLFKIGFSQQITLNIVAKNAENQIVFNNLNFKKNFDDIVQVKDELNNILKKLSEKGFLNSQLDKFYIKDSLYTAVFKFGIPIRKIKIHYSQSVDVPLLKKYILNHNNKTLTIKWSLVEPFLNNLLNTYQKKGQPFTQIRLKNIRLEKDLAIADLDITKNTSRYIDEIVVKNYTDFPKTYINYHLELKAHSLYNPTTLNDISKRLKSLDFVEEIKPPELLFTKTKTKVYLYLKKKHTNTFDGLIGFTSKQNRNGLIFNGYLDINLKNVLNSGETLALLFKSNGENQQIFNLKTEFPYVFKSKITPAVNFNIYKQDTSFINVNTNIGIKYPVNYNSNIGIQINLESSSNLLGQEIASVKTYNAFYYGLIYSFKSFQNDNLFSEKFYLETSVLKGFKTFDNSKDKQFKLKLTASYLWLLNYRSAFYIRSQSGFLNADNFIKNELTRIGGFNTIRGFDEESIFVSNYSIINIEYRYKTAESDFLYTVSDFANYTDPILNSNSNLYSFGLGYQFLSKIGYINLSYVLGKASNQDFNLKNAQIHFNIKAKF
jgi:hypothetical protein